MRIFAKSANPETYIEWKVGRDKRYYWELRLRGSEGGSASLLVIPPYEAVSYTHLTLPTIYSV